MSNESFDLVVVGGGIGGACTAWDASLRGLRVALVEASDFGSGASAHSLKFLHGGIRYLQHLDFSRLRESCDERAAFLRIAPHLTRPLPVAIPTYGHGMRGKWPLRAAFALLEFITRGRNRAIPEESQHIPRPYVMNRADVSAAVPGLDPRGLTGAGVFFDGQIVNPPRLVYSIARSAQEAGAVIANYCSARALLTRNDRVEGLSVRDEVSGNVFDIRAAAVANVAGPFAPALHRAGFSGQPLNVPFSRDMAFVVRRRMATDMALAVQTRYADPDAVLSRGNRHLFLCPWRERYTLIGVHSRIYSEDPRELTVSDDEIDTFLAEINEAWPALAIRRDEIGVVNAGLLPFGENTTGASNLSFGKRSHVIDHAERGGPGGLYTGVAVRWTMGRLLAEKVTDNVLRGMGRPHIPCRTAFTQVWSGPHYRLTPRPASEKLCNMPIDSAGIRRAVEDEMVVTLNDLVMRRLDLGSGEEPAADVLDGVARAAGEVLGWDADRRAHEIARVRRSYPFAGPASQRFSPEAEPR